MSRRWLFIWVAAVPTVMSSCSEKPQPREGEPTQADRERFSGRYRPSPGPPEASAVTPATGDVDRDFLRRMSDQHAGLILLTHAAIESNRSASLQLAIRKIEEDHDHELDTMLAMLRGIYKDRYVPAAAGEYTLISETLRARTGDSATFFRSALRTEEKVLEMINEYLPKSRNARVKRFAEELKRDEPREIAAIRKVLNQR